MSAAVQLDLLAFEKGVAIAIEAILADAEANDGWINPNRVRRALTGPSGENLVGRGDTGKAYRQLRDARVIYRTNGPDWWVISDDKRGGNAGKMAKLYRLRSAGDA